jgi:tRNA(Ile)-lysidine synthase
MREGRADAVATAHTLDDQAETVMMKLLRGAWTEGISGIAPVVEEDSRQQTVDSRRAVGRIVRPLLGVRREEVEAFLRHRGQSWREDATNRDVSLTRNRVRHELMPVLHGFNPEVDRALARLAEIARDEEAFWRAEVGRVLPQVVLPGKAVRGGGRAVSTAPAGGQSSEFGIELERLRPLPEALRRRVLRAAVRGLGVRLTAEETGKVLALGGMGGAVEMKGEVKGKIGSRLELRDGLRVERTARELRFNR